MGRLQWSSLCTKTGMEDFFIAVQGTIEDHTEPKVFFTEKVEKFVCIVLNVEPQWLALRLESWVVSGIGKHCTHVTLTHWQLDMSDATTIGNWQHTLNCIISDCHTLIQEELSKFLLCLMCHYDQMLSIYFTLDDILTEHGVKKRVKMNYTNYELQIIEWYGIVLTGWPVSGCVWNLAMIGGRQAVKKLLDALQSETCKWVKLTAKQQAAWTAQNKAWQAVGEKVYQPWCVHGSGNSGTMSKETIDTSSSDEEDKGA